ncbi:hypothetical protein EF913_36215 [Streptomyces sp. WAC04189]|nr:hypothetical protein EF913_36215 [Streptomyces sp. WAC04189]
MKCASRASRLTQVRQPTGWKTTMALCNSRSPRSTPVSRSTSTLHQGQARPSRCASVIKEVRRALAPHQHERCARELDDRLCNWSTTVSALAR